MSDMKLIMEGWRYQTGKTDFNVLCESFDKGIISEEVLFETWHRRVLTEADEILTEDLMNILKQGWEKGKALSGKAKKVFDAAVQKVSDFFLKLCLQVWTLVQKVKLTLAPIARVLGSVFKRVQKFCSVHPIICKVILALLVMLAVAAVAYFVHNVLQQVQSPNLQICEVCVTTGPDGEVMQLSDTGIDALKGWLGESSSYVEDPEVRQAYVDAFKLVEECSNATTDVELAKAADATTRAVIDVSMDILRESPDDLSRLARLGDKVGIFTREVSSEYTHDLANKTATRISFEELRIIK